MRLPCSALLAAAVTVQAAAASPAGAPPRLTVDVSAVAAQSGARSGITYTLFTQWLPAGRAFAGLSGGVTFSGNDPSFSEALVLVGTTADTHAACLAENNSWPAQATGVQRLWAAILKNDAAGQVSIPVGFTLPRGVALPVTDGGTCLAVSISAGYAFLDAASAKYTRTAVSLSLSLEGAMPGAPVVMPLGLGGEFRFDLAAGPRSYTYVGIRADRTLQVYAIAGSVSAAPVAGAPAGAGWTPLPSGTWAAGTRFLYLPATVCSAAGLVTQPSNGNFAVLRQGTPTAFRMPDGLRTALNMRLAGAGVSALQMSPFRGFSAAGPASLVLAPGDCLVTFTHMLPTGDAGEVDFENQSTVYVALVE